MPNPVGIDDWRSFFIKLSTHARFSLTLYMFVKGLRWGARNNLSLLLVIALFLSVFECAAQSLLISQIVAQCVVHLHFVYTPFAIYAVMLDAILYYRAWCISRSKMTVQIVISAVMTFGHLVVLICDAVYTIHVAQDIAGVGCVTIPGWSRSLFNIFSTVNDIVQVVLFCVPLMYAVKNVSGLRNDCEAYRRMIMKSAVCLFVSTVANITSSILAATPVQLWSLIFSDIGLLFQILSACEIQFNSHRQTDKASLGAFIMQSPLDLRRRMRDHSATVTRDGTTEQVQSFSRVL
ncbi:hypothetical protein HK105_205359 [Polyrhizophydium stewartii]|uniref:Uncharacterized protein n=1 Tax=Polyrhizophydium stewartii TaxID=2732419 RepID=A0ABR4N658_9FUNG